MRRSVICTGSHYSVVTCELSAKSDENQILCTEQELLSTSINSVKMNKK